MEKESTNSNGELLAAKMGDKMIKLMLITWIIIATCCGLMMWFASTTYYHGKENERLKIRIENLVETDSILLFELQKCRSEEINQLK